MRQTNFDNDEAVGYLADRLARLGVEDALAEAGAAPGSGVTIGEVTFDWQPTLGAAASVLPGAVPGPRGTDVRVETSSRHLRRRAAGRVPQPARRRSGRAGGRGRRRAARHRRHRRPGRGGRR